MSDGHMAQYEPYVQNFKKKKKKERNKEGKVKRNERRGGDGG